VPNLSRTVVRNSVFGVGSQFAIKLLSFAFSVLVVRHLGASEYGQYAAALAFGAVFVFLADLGLSPYAVREVARRRDQPNGEADIRALYGNVLTLRFLLSVVTALLLVAAAWLTGRASPRAKRIAPWGPVALLAGWVAVIAIVLYARPPGLDLTGLASLDSAVVTLFIPLSLGGGALLAWVITALAGRRSGWASLLAAAGIATGAGSLLTDVVNPITILADARDLRALEWIEGHLPRSALVAVDGRPWIAPAWVGVDGGYWIGAATSQRSILPPLLYAWALPPAEADRLSAVVSRWSNRRPGSDDGWAALRAAGVTHLYCGSHAVAWKRWELLRSPRCRPLYRDGGVVVFEMRR
jgi:hypothetical protein